MCVCIRLDYNQISIIRINIVDCIIRVYYEHMTVLLLKYFDFLYLYLQFYHLIYLSEQIHLS